MHLRAVRALGRASLVAVAATILGCAAPPPAPPASPVLRPKAELTPRAFDEIAAARGREIALQALSHLGVPYRYGGSSPETGFDCSGLVHYVYRRAAGLALPRSSEAMSVVGSAIEADHLEPGDLVFFDTLRRPFSHVGIYVGDQRFVHAPTSRGAVEIVDLRERYWQRRFNGGRRPMTTGD